MFEFTPRFTAPASLDKYAPDTASTDLQALLRHAMLDGVCAVGPTPLRKKALHVVLHLLIGVSVLAWWGPSYL